MKSNVDYWSQKVALNRRRDANNIRKLRRLGWVVLIVWACEVEDAAKLNALAEAIRRMSTTKRTG